MELQERVQKNLKERYGNSSEEEIMEQEDDNAESAIKELAGNDYSDENDQYKAVQLLKGLASSEEDISNEFFAELNDAFTNIAQKIGVEAD